jgi:hypothetical protein
LAAGHNQSPAQHAVVEELSAVVEKSGVEEQPAAEQQSADDELSARELEESLDTMYNQVIILLNLNLKTLQLKTN